MIGVYVHDVGCGYLHRALCVAREVDDDVTVLTTADCSRYVAPEDLPENVRVLRLPPDSRRAAREDGDPTAPRLPLHDGRPRARARALQGWIERSEPSVFWVEVDTDVLLDLQRSDVAVWATLQPGRRDDLAHRLGYRCADGLLAAWPVGRDAEAVTAAGRLDRAVTEVGGLSRFCGREVEQSDSAHDRPRVVHLNGSDGRFDRRFWGAVRTRTERARSVDWVELGGPDGDWHGDPWAEMCGADVVVCGAGQGVVADAACLDVQMVVVPERRPFGEQEATARAVTGLPGVAVHTYDQGPDAVVTSVFEAVDASRGSSSSGMRSAWSVDGAAARGAEALWQGRRAS